MEAPEKIYFTYNDIHRTIKKLAIEILDSGFDVDVIVAIGTGGFIPARMLKTFINRPVLTVGLSYYDLDNKPRDSIEKIQWIDEVEKKLTGKRILLVDEVDDSRYTLEYCLKELLTHKPSEMAVAVLHNKLKNKRGSIPAEITRYFQGADLEDLWICYPWDAQDIELQDKLANQN
ncbi:MAG: phosphoribosyltransferase [Spirochaetales bacterium]|nr:phosphoribosyltransferase [Spirochaetales bacterium]